jgi:hypothetical protein
VSCTQAVLEIMLYLLVIFFGFDKHVVVVFVEWTPTFFSRVKLLHSPFLGKSCDLCPIFCYSLLVGNPY